MFWNRRTGTNRNRERLGKTAGENHDLRNAGVLLRHSVLRAIRAWPSLPELQAIRRLPMSGFPKPLLRPRQLDPAGVDLHVALDLHLDRGTYLKLHFRTVLQQRPRHSAGYPG